MGAELTPDPPEKHEKPGKVTDSSGFDDLLTRPGDINNNSAANKELAASAQKTEAAVLSGDPKQVKTALTDAFAQAGGDPQKFQQFGKTLAKQLADDGFDVKFGKDSVALHKQGSPDAVEYKLSGSMDLGSGKVTADAKPTAYDWESKKDTAKNPEDIVRGMKGDKIEKAPVADAATIGGDWDKAFQSKDWNKVNTELSAAAKAAFERGGAQGVKALFDDINKNTATENAGAVPIYSKDGRSFQVMNVQTLGQAQTDLVRGMNFSPEELKAKGMQDTSEYGVVKVLNSGPVIGRALATAN